MDAVYVDWGVGGRWCGLLVGCCTFFGRGFSFAYTMEKSAPHPEAAAALAEKEVKVGTCLECVGPVGFRITVEPTSLQSKTHAIMAAKILQQHKRNRG